MALRSVPRTRADGYCNAASCLSASVSNFSASTHRIQLPRVLCLILKLYLSICIGFDIYEPVAISRTFCGFDPMGDKWSLPREMQNIACCMSVLKLD